MFDHTEIELSEEGIPSGESDENSYQLTTAELTATDDPRPDLAGIEELAPGPHLALLLEYLERLDLNGFDRVRLLQARERQLAHLQAEAMADQVAIAHSPPGDSGSDPGWLHDAGEFAADEIRAALRLTRRSAEFRLCEATDLIERLPRVWSLLSHGQIDLARARVFIRGTAHVPKAVARSVVDALATVAPDLTTGQLAHRIRRLCIVIDPEDATARTRTEHYERRFVIEPTVDGNADLYLLGIPLAEARSIGRRINGYLISLKREDRSGRNHDQLRADIAVDLLKGADRRGQGGSVEIRVDLETLAHLNENPAEIPGLGPIVADVARQVVDGAHKAQWHVSITDGTGQVLGVVPTRRRPGKALSRHIAATKPNCSFPGCLVPASDCDNDHLTPWSQGGVTTERNMGPKCRHDHILKDRGGWKHFHTRGQDFWTSPLGHRYVTQRDPP